MSKAIVRLCPRCQTEVVKSTVKGYPYECTYCDENFYNFELIKIEKEEYQESKINRIDVLLANSLSWIFDHCVDTESYLNVLESYIGMTEEEVNLKSGL